MMMYPLRLMLRMVRLIGCCFPYVLMFICSPLDPFLRVLLFSCITINTFRFSYIIRIMGESRRFFAIIVI